MAAREYEYDLVCIGAGSGGVRAARMSAQFGAKVAVRAAPRLHHTPPWLAHLVAQVVELPYNMKSSEAAGGAGGTCVIRGCVPKKLFVYGSHFSEEFRDAAGFGWGATQPEHVWPTLLKAKNAEVARLSGVYTKLLSNAGVDYIEGRASVADAHTVTVDGGRTLRCANILVATGGRATVPPLPGAAELGLTSDDALLVPAVPKRVAIIGSGYIGLEFACIFHGFGAETHLVYRQELPLRGFDEEVRAFVSESLRTKGVRIHAKRSPVSLAMAPSGAHKLLTLDDGTVLEVDEVLFATGRAPNSHNIGLEAAGVELAKNGAIKVDAYSRTNVPSIWAVGDVTDRVNLTPVALMEGMALAKTLFKNEPTRPDHENIAAAVFMQPPVSTVGLSEEAAASAYPGGVDVYTSTFKPMKNSISGRDEKFFMKLVVDPASDKVVGIHLVGADAPEMMQGFAVALKCGATKTHFDATVGIHPTAAEEARPRRAPPPAASPRADAHFCSAPPFPTACHDAHRHAQGPPGARG